MGLEGIGGGEVISIVVKAVDKYSKTLTKAKASIRSLGKNFVVAGAAMTAAGVGGAMALNNFVQVAADAEGAQNKFNAVFKDGTNDMNKFVDDLRKRMPSSRQEIVRMAADLQDLLVPMGIARDKAQGMTKKFLNVADAIAAFNDKDPSEVLGAIRSGITGESEPLKNLGVDARQTSLELVAMQNGLLKQGQTFKDLDPVVRNQIQSQALLIQIYAQSKDAIDGYVKNNDSLLRKQQNLQASFTDLKKEIGDALIPVWEFLIEKIQKVVSWFSNLTEGQKKAIAIIAVAGVGLTIFAGVVLMLAGAILVLTTVSTPWLLIIMAIIAAIGILIAVFMYWGTIVKWVKDKVLTPIWEYIKKRFGPEIQILSEEIRLLGLVFRWLKDNALVPVWNFFKNIYQWLKEKFLVIIDKISGAFKKISDFTGGVRQGIADAITGQTSKIGKAASKTKKVNDFILRPGGQLIETSPQDTIFGTKSGRGMSGGLSISITGNNIYGTDPDEIASALSDKLRKKITL